MPSNIGVGAFVLGSVLLLIGLIGGKFTLFGVQIADGVGKSVRWTSGCLGVVLLAWALMPPTAPLSPAPIQQAKPTTVADQSEPVSAVVPSSLQSSPSFGYTFHENGVTYHGTFEKQAADAWSEYSDKPGDHSKQFHELSETQEWIVLRDEGRNMDVRIPVAGGVSQWQIIGSTGWNNMHIVAPAGS